jgi:hypothetical protein
MDHAAGIPNYAFNVSLFRLEFRTWIFLPARDSESLNTPNELTRARARARPIYGYRGFPRDFSPFCRAAPARGRQRSNPRARMRAVGMKRETSEPKAGHRSPLRAELITHLVAWDTANNVSK